MAVVREKITLRKRRKNEGERQSKSIKLDRLNEGDNLIVEIVIDRINGIAKKYQFTPKDLEGRKNITFRVSSDNEVRWLNGLDPKELLRDRHQDAPVREKVEETPRKERKRRQAVKRIIVFDANGKLTATFENLDAAARHTGLLPEAIERMCRTHKQSRETGLWFRHYSEATGIPLHDFAITLVRYDTMDKRKKHNISQEI